MSGLFLHESQNFVNYRRFNSPPFFHKNSVHSPYPCTQGTQNGGKYREILRMVQPSGEKIVVTLRSIREQLLLLQERDTAANMREKL
jgi:hypothetical protein